jgi:hypothetical protein
MRLSRKSKISLLKILSPQSKIEVAIEVIQRLGVFERKACKVLELNRIVKEIQSEEA